MRSPSGSNALMMATVVPVGWFSLTVAAVVSFKAKHEIKLGIAE